MRVGNRSGREYGYWPVRPLPRRRRRMLRSPRMAGTFITSGFAFLGYPAGARGRLVSPCPLKAKTTAVVPTEKGGLHPGRLERRQREGMPPCVEEVSHPCPSRSSPCSGGRSSSRRRPSRRARGPRGPCTRPSRGLPANAPSSVRERGVRGPREPVEYRLVRRGPPGEIPPKMIASCGRRCRKGSQTRSAGRRPRPATPPISL